MEKYTVEIRQALYRFVLMYRRLEYAQDMLEPHQADFLAALKGIKPTYDDLCRDIPVDSMEVKLFIDGVNSLWDRKKELGIVKGGVDFWCLACRNLKHCKNKN